MIDSPYEHHAYDVLIIGAGGAGLRAAIEAQQRGLKVGIITKSLLGKAHTVMAEGGIAAAMGNIYPEDNWKVHFRDTMRGGKYLNNNRMAELHAKESPDRVWELEQWGALFDRTKDGKILQRDFGGHRYARLAHVGDRTGLELIRTLQQKVVSMGVKVAAPDGAAPQAHARPQIGIVVDHGALYEGVGPDPDVAAQDRVLPQCGARFHAAIIPDYRRAPHLRGGVHLGSVAQPNALPQRKPH